MPEAPTTKRKTLLDIGDDMLALDQLLEDCGGDLSDPAVEQYISTLIGELGDDLNNKVDGYCQFIRELELRISVRKAEIDQLSLRNRADANAVESLKNRLKMFMENRGIKKAGAIRTASLSGNGGKLPLFIEPGVLAEPKKLPPRFQRVTVAIDTNAVREALDAGEKLPFAIFEQRGVHLRIR